MDDGPRAVRLPLRPDVLNLGQPFRALQPVHLRPGAGRAPARPGPRRRRQRPGPGRQWRQPSRDFPDARLQSERHQRIPLRPQVPGRRQGHRQRGAVGGRREPVRHPRRGHLGEPVRTASFHHERQPPVHRPRRVGLPAQHQGHVDLPVDEQSHDHSRQPQPEDRSRRALRPHEHPRFPKRSGPARFQWPVQRHQPRGFPARLGERRDQEHAGPQRPALPQLHVLRPGRLEGHPGPDAESGRSLRAHVALVRRRQPDEQALDRSRNVWPDDPGRTVGRQLVGPGLGEHGRQQLGSAGRLRVAARTPMDLPRRGRGLLRRPTGPGSFRPHAGQFSVRRPSQESCRGGGPPVPLAGRVPGGLSRGSERRGEPAARDRPPALVDRISAADDVPVELQPAAATVERPRRHGRLCRFGVELPARLL